MVCAGVCAAVADTVNAAPSRAAAAVRISRISAPRIVSGQPSTARARCESMRRVGIISRRGEIVGIRIVQSPFDRPVRPMSHGGDETMRMTVFGHARG